MIIDLHLPKICLNTSRRSFLRKEVVDTTRTLFDGPSGRRAARAGVRAGVRAFAEITVPIVFFLFFLQI